MLSIQLTCHSDHKQTWESQPVLKKKPLGNLLMAGAILFTGNSYTSISRLTGVIRLKHITHLHTENLQKQSLPLAQVADRNS